MNEHKTDDRDCSPYFPFTRSTFRLLVKHLQAIGRLLGP